MCPCRHCICWQAPPPPSPKITPKIKRKSQCCAALIMSLNDVQSPSPPPSPQGKDTIYDSQGGTVKRLRQTKYSTRFASAKGAVLFFYSPGGQIARTRRCRRCIDAIFSSVLLLLLLLFPFFFSLSPYRERK